MTWPTHTLLGICTLWLLAPFPPELLGYDLGTLAACAALGALLPDLDAPQSKIKHLKIPSTRLEPFRVPAQIVNRTEQHRGLLHSLAGISMAALMTVPFGFCIGWAPVTALLLGYASHLVADSATVADIMPPRHECQRARLPAASGLPVLFAPPLQRGAASISLCVAGRHLCYL